MAQVNIQELDKSVQQMRQLAEELKVKAGNIQAVVRNLNRLSASIKMLELNISDIKEYL
jgi:hypothetical protein